ncbi:molybdopterin molybdotransferase MoeA [soil metagenome]
MISYVDALELILSLPVVTRIEAIPLQDSYGRVLAGPVAASWPLPRFDNSSMDGFAVRAADIAPDGSLPIVGESAAGRGFGGSLPPRAAIRISTGAQVPYGADSVIPKEAAPESTPDRMHLAQTEVLKVGQYLRKKGSDVAIGEIIATAGSVIGSELLALLSSFNISRISVVKRPKAAILTSGDEIKPLGGVLREGDIIGSSIYYLRNELEACGCEVRDFGISTDDPADFRQRYEDALAWGDLVVTTAGVSVGDHDVVGSAISDLGMTVHFWKVAVRPGKPMLLASKGGKVHFGLPGNPVSTCCNTEIFVKPYLRRIMGIEPAQAPLQKMRLTAPARPDPSRLFFLNAKWRLNDGIAIVEPLDNQNSGNLLNPSKGNALIVLPPGNEIVPEGDSVAVIMLHSGLT